MTYFSDQARFIPVWLDRDPTSLRLRINSSSSAELGIDATDDTSGEFSWFWLAAEGLVEKAVLKEKKIDPHLANIFINPSMCLNYHEL